MSAPEDGAPLYVTRHAPTALKGLCYGQHDVPVTLPPIDAAVAVAKQVTGLGIGVVVASPWRRTEPVGRLVAAHLGVPFRIDGRLSEIAMGAWEGQPYARLAAEDGARFSAWMHAWQVAAPPGGEALPVFLARVQEVVRERRPLPVLAVTHAGVVRAARALLRGVAYAEVAGEPVVPLTVELASPAGVPAPVGPDGHRPPRRDVSPG